MGFTAKMVLVTAALFAGMIATEVLGIVLGRRRIARYGDRKTRSNAVDTLVFNLLGLLLAFSFYSATGRFDQLRRLVNDEINATGGAYQRLDLLPAPARDELRATFRDYLQSRIDVYRAEPETWEQPAAASRRLRDKIWREATAACNPATCPAATTTLLFSSLTQMFDLATNQWLSSRMHPPMIVFAMLFGIAMLGGWLVGRDLAQLVPRSWVYLLAYPITLSFIVWVILELEYPRLGAIRIDDFDELFVTMHQRMGS